VPFFLASLLAVVIGVGFFSEH